MINNYRDWISEQLDRTIEYTEYICENLDRTIKYTAESIPTIDYMQKTKTLNRKDRIENLNLDK